jgi:hypothetical protein
METRLITGIDVTAGRPLHITSVSWDDYWGFPGFLTAGISRLKATWISLIVDKFSGIHRSEFVRAYFALLHECLACLAGGSTDLQILKKIVAFETFRISGQVGGAIAGIFNARNPAYLLSKVGMPNSPENPKHLPLVSPYASSSEPSILYRHYRRIPIARTSGCQLFVYPPAAGHDHALSYSLLAQLFKCLTPRADPWVRERCQSLFTGLFAPLVVTSTSQRLHLLDIACGSAMVSMAMCKKAFVTHRKSFDLTLIDVIHGSKTIANTFYRNLHAFGNVVYRRENLFAWLDDDQAHHKEQFDIALLLRACDVFSRVTIQELSYGEVNSLLQKRRGRQPVDAHVLRPDELIADGKPHKIQHGIDRLTFNDGSVFCQFSLSEYFRALHILMGGRYPCGGTSVCVPVRTFDSNSLVLPSGRSLVERVMRMSRHLVVEDVDMSTRHLQRHLDEFRLHDVYATDVTKRTSLRGATVHLIAGKGSR